MSRVKRGRPSIEAAIPPMIVAGICAPSSHAAKSARAACRDAGRCSVTQSLPQSGPTDADLLGLHVSVRLCGEKVPCRYERGELA